MTRQTASVKDSLEIWLQISPENEKAGFYPGLSYTFYNEN